MKPRAYGVTDVGRCREINQDELLIDHELSLFAVADGMGGHAAGEVASQIAIECLANEVRSAAQDKTPPTVEEAGRWLEHAFISGNRRIYESVQAHGEWRGMGTTIVALLALPGEVVVAHVGDSRAYRLRGDELDRLTSDHSWVNEQVKLGLMTDDEAHRHPMRNIVTRALGNRIDLEVDVNRLPVEPGDVIVLCSDGLNSMLCDEEIRTTLVRHAEDPESACKALVENANSRGGEDNITVIVMAFAADASNEPPSAETPK